MVVDANDAELILDTEIKGHLGDVDRCREITTTFLLTRLQTSRYCLRVRVWRHFGNNMVENRYNGRI